MGNFDQALFNQAGFSSPQQTREDFVAGFTLQVNFEAMVIAGGNIIADFTLNEAWRHWSYTTIGIYGAFELLQEWSWNTGAELFVNAHMITTWNEIWTMDIFLSLNHYEPHVYDWQMAMDVFLSKNLLYGFELHWKFEQWANLCMNFHPPLPTVITWIWDSEVWIDQFDISYIDINVNIPVGSKLVIDSHTYNVTLDDNNIIHLHSGDWLFLNQETFEVRVSSVTAMNSTNTIHYIERWL